MGCALPDGAAYVSLKGMIDVSSISPKSDSSNGADADLVARLQAGDEQAFEQLVREHGPRMLAVARRLLPQEQDAQDAVQDAFLSAFRSIDRFQEKSKLATWLHQIVVNAALMKLRRRSRRPEKTLEDFTPAFQQDGRPETTPSRWAVSFDTAVADRETREVVRRGVAQLPDDYRAVLVLRDLEGYSTKETAELLQISDANVKTRLHRARHALRTLLDPYMNGAAS